MRTLLHAPRSRKRSIAAATLSALALVGSLLVATPAQALNDTGTGGVFVPSAGRVLDTSKGTGGFSTPMEAGKYRTIKVAGLAGLPDDGSVGAVSLNATVGSAPGNGTLFGRPDGDTSRTTMLIYNGNSGEYTSNSATVAVGAGGTIQVMTETSARLILDVQGYYSSNADGTAAGGFVPIAKRIVDTRSGTGAAKATIAPGKSIDVQVTGANGVPAGASGVVVNLIAANATNADGYLTPFATGGTKPANSLHYAPSANTSIQAQVPLSAAGKMTIANSSTTTNLLVDLQGYFTAAGKGGAAFTPAYGRAYDSRASGNTVLGEQETRSIQIAGTAGVPVMGSGITAVVLTLIVAHGGGDGYADVWADGTAKPNTTAINFNTNEIQTNTITVPLGANGKISLRNAAKATNYVVDVQGWYSNPAAPTISCPAPYAAGGLAAEVPDDAITCSARFQASLGSDDTATVSADGDETDVALSATGPVTVPISVESFAGEHDLDATLFTNGISLDVPYVFTMGESWTAASIAPLPEPAAKVSKRPIFALSLDNSGLPSDEQVQYRIYSDSAETELVDASPWMTGNYERNSDLPEGEYYWSAVIEGTNPANGQLSSRTTEAWQFSVNADADAPDDGFPASDGSETSDYVADSAATDTQGLSVRSLRGVEADYGPCTLWPSVAHLRRSGNWKTVGVKPYTQCGSGPKRKTAKKVSTISMAAQLWTASVDIFGFQHYNKVGSSTGWESPDKQPASYFQIQDLKHQCNGKKETYWTGSATGRITYNKRLYRANVDASIVKLECGA